MRIGVLTSGGDAPGMNAAIRSLTKAGIARGHTVLGGSPSAVDRILAQRLAVGALFALEAGAHDELLAWETTAGLATQDASVNREPLDQALAETERVLDVSSPATVRRVALMRSAEALLAL